METCRERTSGKHHNGFRSPEVVSELSDEELERSDDEGIIDADSEDEVNYDESMEIDSEDEGDSGSVSNSNDPWEDLRAEVKTSLSQSHDKQVERFLEKVVSGAVAGAKAFNALLPFFRRKLRRFYLHYLKWFRRLKRDPVHEEVMKTLRRFMDDESMDYEEQLWTVESFY